MSLPDMSGVQIHHRNPAAAQLSQADWIEFGADVQEEKWAWTFVALPFWQACEGLMDSSSSRKGTGRFLDRSFHESPR